MPVLNSSAMRTEFYSDFTRSRDDLPQPSAPSTDRYLPTSTSNNLNTAANQDQLPSYHGHKEKNIANDFKEALLLPFKASSWFYISYILLNLPLSLIGSLYILLSFIFPFILMVFPPFGIILLFILLCSWRLMANIEVVLILQYLYKTTTPLSLKSNTNITEEVTDAGLSKKVFSFLQDFYTWKCFFYFSLIKPLWSIVSFVSMVTLFTASIFFMFNWIVVLRYKHFYNGIHENNFTWIYTSLPGSLILLPIGIIGIFLSFYITEKLMKATSDFVLEFL